LVVLALVCTLQAQDSGNVIPFQGQLANQAGQPLSPTNAVTLVFRLYQVAVGGVAIWEESQPSISVSAGRFSVLLGSRTLLPAQTYFNSTLYLGITVDDGNPATADVELRPRQALVPVVSASYAKNAGKLNGYDWSALFGTNNPVDGSLLPSKIGSNSITAAQIASATITSNQIASGTITAIQIAPGGVTQTAIASGAVGRLQIANGAVAGQQIAAGGIQTSNLADGAVSFPKLAARQVGTNVAVGGVAISPLVSTSASTGTAVPGLTVTLITTGRPVMVALSGGSTNSRSYINIGCPVLYQLAAEVLFLRNGSQVSDQVYDVYGIGNPAGYVPPSIFQFIDFPPVGTNTYSIQISNGGFTGCAVNLNNVQLVAFEL
jgi:hypothetical protein